MKKAAPTSRRGAGPDNSEFHEQYGDGKMHHCSRRLTAAEQEIMRYNGLPDEMTQGEDVEDGIDSL